MTLLHVVELVYRIHAGVGVANGPEEQLHRVEPTSGNHVGVVGEDTSLFLFHTPPLRNLGKPPEPVPSCMITVISAGLLTPIVLTVSSSFRQFDTSWWSTVLPSSVLGDPASSGAIWVSMYA